MLLLLLLLLLLLPAEQTQVWGRSCTSTRIRTFE
jgi:hypothetical protein